MIDRVMPVMLTSKDRRNFPLCPDTVPMSILDEAWARKIHYQDLQTLASRGGMSPQEVMGNIEKKDFHEIQHIGLREAINFLVNQMLTWRGPC